MTEPHIQASCARCHLPGEKPGQARLLQGAELYAGLGCAVCHPLTEDGLGGFDFGPDLRTIGRRSPAYLETSLIEPAANFAGSTMPSFALALRSSPDELTSLVIYLESLALSRLGTCRDRDGSRSVVTSPCADCHAGPGGAASGRKAHRCPFLLKRKDELTCRNCHSETVPEPGTGRGYCPFIKQHRDACDACHEGGAGALR